MDSKMEGEVEKMATEFDTLLEGKENGKDIDPEKLKKEKAIFIMRAMRMLLSCCTGQPKSKPASRKSSDTKAPTPAPKANNTSGRGHKMGPIKPRDPEIESIFEPLKQEILEEITEKTGKTPENIEVARYRTQTVLGVNYFIEVTLGDGSSTIHVKIYGPVDGEPVLKAISDLKGPSEALEYF